ncbi:MAG: hypothetical protein Q9161_009256 [Pseudevernia consocians]
MQKPINTEGLDLTFLFDSTYPGLGITEASNMAAASNTMPGFTPDGGISWPAYNKDKKGTIERYAHAFGVFVFESGMWLEGKGITFESGATGA